MRKLIYKKYGKIRQISKKGFSHDQKSNDYT